MQLSTRAWAPCCGFSSTSRSSSMQTDTQSTAGETKDVVHVFLCTHQALRKMLCHW